MTAIRRVVTGLDDQGRSTVVIDDVQTIAGAHVLWHSETLPADNQGRADAGDRAFSTDLFRSPGSTFMMFELPPGDPEGGPLVHATDTIDYIVVLKGRLELVLEEGSVELGPGDCVVDRGVVHAWRALGGESAITVGALVPAHPLGAGATI